MPLRYAVHAVQTAPRVWPELQDLIAGIPVPIQGSEPTALELAGLARRDVGKLRLGWSSLYAQIFAEDFYTPWRFGDLYASAGKWEEAFHHYRRIGRPELKRRPFSDDDETALNSCLDALALEFYRKRYGRINPATNGANAGVERDECKWLLTQALEHILGLEDVSFWRNVGGVWAPERRELTTASVPKRITQHWDEARDESALAGHLAGYHWGVCWSGKGEPERAVLVQGLDDPLAEHPARKAVIERILRAYQKASEIHSLTYSLWQRLNYRNALFDAIGEVLNVFGNQDWELERTLKKVAEEIVTSLENLPRVAFLLVEETDPSGIRLRPICDTAREQTKPCGFRSFRLDHSVATLIEQEAPTCFPARRLPEPARPIWALIRKRPIRSCTSRDEQRIPVRRGRQS